MSRLLAFITCAGLVVAIAGCTREGADLLAVKGTVTFEGKPLPQGIINFELDDAANPFLSGAPIEAGTFSIAQAQGLKPGTYLVRISSGDPSALDENQPPGESRPVAKDRIPASWNVESKQKVEVKAGATDLTFDIK